MLIHIKILHRNNYCMFLKILCACFLALLLHARALGIFTPQNESKISALY